MIIRVSNPFVEQNLSQFRDKNTTPYFARKSVENISYCLATEVSKLIRTSQSIVETPLGSARGGYLDEKIELVPIIRAGMAMLEPFSECFRDAHIGMVACERAHDLSIRLAYEKVSKCLEGKTIVILDTMLATGSTIEAVIDLLEPRHPDRIIIASILAVPKGIERLSKKGDYIIVTVRDNEGLDDNNYIYPGVGDSGDRLYGSI